MAHELTEIKAIDTFVYSGDTVLKGATRSFAKETAEFLISSGLAEPVEVKPPVKSKKAEG